MLNEEMFELAQVQGEKPPVKEGEVKTTEKGKEEKKVELKPYPVYGQDFSLTDPDIIDYYKTRMKMMAITYRLVGRVNDNAQYLIADDIRYDLVGMEKEIEENGEDYYKAIALYMKKHFYFHIKIQQIEDGKAKASLYLSEYVEDFLGLDSIVSHIADFVDVYDDEYRIRLRKAFNLVDVATKVDDFAVPNLAVIMQDCFDLELLVGGLYDMASQIFVMRLLKALEESGEAGAAVLARYRELLAGKDIELNDKFRYSHYKALLDRAIDELGGYEKLGLDPEVIKSIMKDINGTVKAIDNASARGGMVEFNAPKKADENKKSASKSSSSSAGKKSGGSSNSSKPSSPKKASAPKKETAKPGVKKGEGVLADSIRAIFEREAPKLPPRGRRPHRDVDREPEIERRPPPPPPPIPPRETETVVIEEVEIEFDLVDDGNEISIEVEVEIEVDIVEEIAIEDENSKKDKEVNIEDEFVSEDEAENI